MRVHLLYRALKVQRVVTLDLISLCLHLRIGLPRVSPRGAGDVMLNAREKKPHWMTDNYQKPTENMRRNWRGLRDSRG